MNARCALVCSVSGICVFCMRVIVQMVASPLNLARGRAENNWRATKCWLNQHQQRSSSFQSNRMPRRFLHCIYIVFATKIRFFFCWNSLSCSLYLVWNLEREKICATSRISSIFICKGFRWYGLLVWCTLVVYNVQHWPFCLLVCCTNVHYSVHCTALTALCCLVRRSVVGWSSWDRCMLVIENMTRDYDYAPFGSVD